MANFNISTTLNACTVFWKAVEAEQGLVKNPDGTISVYLKNPNNVKTPYQVTKACCDVLENSLNQGYYFDLNTQKCRWSTQSTLDCGFDKPFKIVLNPVGNDGAIFNVEEGEFSSLIVDFDYLFKLDCESLVQKISQTQPINPELTKQIRELENKILDQTVQCEKIASDIAYYENKFNNTNYSFFCDLDTQSGTTPTSSASTVVTNPFSGLTRPNFGGLPSFGLPSFSGITRPTPSLPPGDFYLAPTDLTGIFNTNSFINSRSPISNLFVPQIRPSLLSSLVLETVSSATTTPLFVFPTISRASIPKNPIVNSPVKPILNVSITNNKQIVPFTKTGFGSFGTGLPPFAFPANTTTPSNGLYCIIEPKGLKEWENILGADKYTRFINGDNTSYTCRDATLMFNNPDRNLLIVNCDTPFGTKTEIQNTINNKKKEQQACNDILITLNNDLQILKDLNTIDTNICGTPISVLENLKVSVNIDVVYPSGLTTEFEYSLFDSIGSGNLYKYLNNKRNYSGFFICGQPNKSEPFTGCTGLNYPEFSGVTIPDNAPKTNVTSCTNIKGYFYDSLLQQSGLSGQTNGLKVFKESLVPNILSSDWLHSTKVINDPIFIKKIKNRKIKVSIKVNTSCGDLCLLIDHITLNNETTKVSGSNILLTTSPGFKLTRVSDNKKSWANDTTSNNRKFLINDVNGTNPIRQTDYNVNDERLIINSKEIDLDIDMANAIETDFWNYTAKNPCLFTGRTEIYNCNDAYNYSKQFQDGFCFQYEDNEIYTFMDDEQVILSNGATSSPYVTAKCGDDNLNFKKLMTTDISTINTLQNFNDFMTSEFIDAKNRNTIIGYGTLRALYERYLNSSLYCNTSSNKFDYLNMNTFANLLNHYWIDMVEQVIPSTTMWGSVKVYRNTIFDQQKFKYKSYTTIYNKQKFLGVTPTSKIDDTYGMCSPVEVKTTMVTKNNSATTNPTETTYDYINLIQMNTSSEFIGTITIR